MHIETKEVIFLGLFLIAILTVLDSESLKKKKPAKERYFGFCFWSKVDKEIVCFERSSLIGKIGSFLLIYLLKICEIIGNTIQGIFGFTLLNVSNVLKIFY